MRVLFVADAVGGVRTFTWELTRALAAQGVEVHLGLLAPGAAAEAAAAVEELPAASYEVSRLALEWMPDPWGDVAAAGEWVDDLVARIRPDVLHMNTFTPVLDPDVPVVLTVHSCVLSWWRAVHGADAPGYRRYRALARAAIDRAARVLAPSRALLSELRGVYGRLGRTGVVYGGRHVQAAGSVPVAERERLVVTVGRLWDEAKNAGLVAAAAPHIAGRVAAIGPGSVTGIEHLGPLPEAEVLAWLGRAAVFAEPARFEPFGLSAVEAAQCGCPLVLGDIPSLREVWGEAATYVSPTDADALAHAVNGLLGDSARRARAARAAAARAARYTPAATASGYLRAYLAAAELPAAVRA